MKLMRDDQFEVFCLVTTWEGEVARRHVAQNGYLQAVCSALTELVEEKVQQRDVG